MTETVTRALGEATVQELRDAIHGQVLRPGEDGYLESARVWNGAYAVSYTHLTLPTN